MFFPFFSRFCFPFFLLFFALFFFLSVFFFFSFFFVFFSVVFVFFIFGFSFPFLFLFLSCFFGNSSNVFFFACVFFIIYCYCIFLISLILLAGVEFKEFWLFPQLYVAGKTYLKKLFQCFYLENSFVKNQKRWILQKDQISFFFEKRNMGKSRISLNSRPAFESKDFAETKKNTQKT